MKTRLSIPSTISSAISVMRLAQIAGSVIHSKVKNSIAGPAGESGHSTVLPQGYFPLQHDRDLCVSGLAHHLHPDLAVVALEVHVHDGVRDRQARELQAIDEARQLRMQEPDVRR